MTYFPEWMKQARRWMVRPVKDGDEKKPFSAHESCPIDYEARKGKNPKFWKYHWTTPAVWASYAEAVSYAQRHADTVEGLSFVLHPAGDESEALRPVCLDLDGCLKKGVLDPEAAALVEAVDSFTEVSRSGKSLHIVVLVKCKPFDNVIQAELGGFHVDVLCRSQIAVTGKVFDGRRELREVPFSFLESLPFVKVKRSTTVDAGDFWSRESNGSDRDRLEDELKAWDPLVQGSGNADKHLFPAACLILRHGFTGQEADDLLQLVPQDPPFTTRERAHKLESAYKHTLGDGSFATLGVMNEFPEIPTDEPEQKPDPNPYGFTVISAEDLEDEDLELTYIVDRAFVDKQPLFIGGREKCFKTGIAADLLVSLATGSKFLGQFQVTGKRSSVFFTAEIGLAPAQLLIRRIREEKQIPRGHLDKLWVVDMVPTFSVNKAGLHTDPKGIRGLKRFLDDYRPEVAVFDPLYFALGGAAVGDMYEIGAVLKAISTICRERDIWPIFCHHARKDSSKEFQPMDLADFYGSGVSAFARQWILLSHAEPYRQGVARLFAKIGGSASGDGGLWKLEIDEGVPDAILDRTWKVSVEETGDSYAGVSPVEVIAAMKAGHGTPTTQKDIAKRLGVEPKKLDFVVSQLLREDEITIIDGKLSLFGGTDEFGL